MRRGPRFRAGYDPDKYTPAAAVSTKTIRKRPRDRDGYDPANYIPQDQQPEPSSPSRQNLFAGSTSALQDNRRSAKRRKLSHVVCPGPAYPLSAHESGEPLPTSLERNALEALLRTHDELYASDTGPPEYTYFELSDFSVYRPSDVKCNLRYRGELVTLDRLLRHGDGCESYVFDGVLSCGEEQHLLQGVHFNIMAVDGYGEDSMDPEITQSITIQSQLANRIAVWYRLGVPSTVYKRFYEPFLWLVQFAKFFVNYLLKTEEVKLDHFIREGLFVNWLRMTYDQDERLTDWHANCAKLDDFRTSVAANIGFLHKECYSLDRRLCKHPVWDEVDPLRLNAIQTQESIHTDTVVTPFVRRCFQGMYFAGKLAEFDISEPQIRAKVQQLKLRRRLTPWSEEPQDEVPSLPTPQSLSPERARSPHSLRIRAGDVVAVEPDTDGHWASTDDVWYVYVQQVRLGPKSGEAVIDVLWLYRPTDTTIGTARYPFPKELFLSDNCSCGEAAIPLRSVLAKVEVAWDVVDPATASTLFVRRKFRTVHEEDHYSFETIGEADWTCSCNKNVSGWYECFKQYRPGDTVLTLLPNNPLVKKFRDIGESSDAEESSHEDEGSGHGRRLEPARIVDFDRFTRKVLLRLFVRESYRKSAARKNELALSDVYRKVTPSCIVRKCHLLTLSSEEDIPVPYDRNGAGDCYYMRSKVDALDPEQLSSFSSPTTSPIGREWDPRQAQPKLRGLGIFCGGGNFDRGLEDGGAVEFKYAVDWAEHALHSYRANARHDTKYYLGSVDDYLASTIQGTVDVNVARVGDVDIISAGSPCPGFSNLQTDKYSEQSMKNASMVASVLAYVDIYVPTYLILENVVSMTRPMGLDKKQNVFSQMLATLVAMGYQVQQFLMDAWTVGSSEQRTRLFIVASAPGARTLPTPPHTHDHPASMKMRLTSLGQCANGLSFSTRRDDWTPLPCTPIADTCADLPSIGDAQVQLCPAFPDHRTPHYESGAGRSRIGLVPIHPAGQSLALAVAAGRISGGEPHAYFENLGPLAKRSESKSFARVHADRLVPTMITALCPRCAKTGRVLHWQEHRLLTIMECRRAQGFPDEEVLVGSPFQQMKIIGNSVNRYVALALGMSLREAWNETILRDPTMASRAEVVCRTEEARSSAESSIATPESEAFSTKRKGFVVLPSRMDSTPRKASPHTQEDTPKDSPVKLSPEQIQDIRKHGFKAILRILDSNDHLNGRDDSGT